MSLDFHPTLQDDKPCFPISIIYQKRSDKLTDLFIGENARASVICALRTCAQARVSVKVMPRQLRLKH